MKFINYEQERKKRLGILTKDGAGIYSIGQLLGKDFCHMIQLIEEISQEQLMELERAAVGSGNFSVTPLTAVKILAPIEKPIHDIICVGVNYRAHLEEAKESPGAGGILEEPQKPVYFSKRAIKILGSGQPIRSRLDLDEELDYEAELAVIIGKTGSDIPKERVEEYIFGYSVFNDISSRKLQRSHLQWYRGKSLDTYAAMGPVILHKNALPFPVEVEIGSTVNGQQRQHSNTSLFLTDLPSLIAELSAGMTLEAGDIIATGTPAGVGMGFQPPRYMKRGDLVVCEIPQIGELINSVE